jgi:hypothetical protein
MKTKCSNSKSNLSKSVSTMQRAFSTWYFVLTQNLSLSLLSLALTLTHAISQSINEQISEQVFYVFGGVVELKHVMLRHFSGTIQALEGTLCSCSDK